MVSRILTIMFTDIKGFTERTRAASRSDLRQMLARHDDLLLPVVRRFHGELIKTIGDALLVSFDSPTNAVLCGLMLQETLREHNEKHVDEKEQLEIRVAINSGEVELRGGDIFGEAVNVAARVEGITEASEVYFTEAVYLAMNKVEVPSSEIGLRRLKGVPEPVKVYKVIQDRNSGDFLDLLTRLRSDEFSDVSLPTTGEAVGGLDRDRTPARWKLVAGSLFAALLLGVTLVRWMSGPSLEQEIGNIESARQQGEIGLALANVSRLIQTHPQDSRLHQLLETLVEDQIGALVARERYEDAARKIDDYTAARPYLDLSESRIELEVAMAESFAKKNNERESVKQFVRLMDNYPGHIKLRERVVAVWGNPKRSIPARVAIRAAKELADLSEGELSLGNARTLSLGLAQLRVNSPYSNQIREILAGRFSEAKEFFAVMLEDKRPEKRIHAYRVLDQQGSLDAGDRLRYHLGNITKTRSSYRAEAKVSMRWLEEQSQKENWSELKKNANLPEIQSVAALNAFSGFADEVASTLVTAFLPEIESQLVAWAKGTDDPYRVHAKKMLDSAGMENRYDANDYYGVTLLTFDPRYHPAHFSEALAYISSRRDGDHRTKLLKALRAGEKRLESEAVRHKNTGWIKEIEKNLNQVRDLIGKF